MKGKTIHRHETREEQLKRLAHDWAEFQEKRKLLAKSEPIPCLPPRIKRPEKWRRKRNLVAHGPVIGKFWGTFNNLRTVDGKLALLREMAEIELPNSVPYKIRRNHALTRKRTGRCRVCSGRGSHMHHIIQVQHGGRNKKTNLIELCEQCHESIHPWMKAMKLLPEMAETMARVEREP